MALKLTLKPHEKAVINGAVIANGDRRASFVIENHANLLRESDIIQPEDATTPAKRVYLPVMLMIVGQERTEALFEEFEVRLKEFASVVSDVEALQTCAALAVKVANGEYYKALSLCRSLIAFEKTRLPDVA